MSIAVEWRKGQIAYNVLSVVRPDLAHKINNTDLDPFHDDDRLDNFWRWLATQEPNDDD